MIKYIEGEIPKKKKVVIVAMTRHYLLDFAGPADIFNFATRYVQQSGPEEGYDVVIAAPTPDKMIKPTTGIEIHCSVSAMEIEKPIDTLIIAGNDFHERTADEEAPFYEWLSTMNAGNTRRIASVCGGAFVLAKAGLLAGRNATTHWSLSEKLKKNYPDIQVNTNPFFIKDGPVYTSAGVSSGIDLALALVEEDYGRDIAVRVARQLVFYLNRPGFQSQFGNLLPAHDVANVANTLQGWLEEHLHEQLDVSRIAAHLNMSVRNFTRVFHKQTGMSPAKFVEKLRIEVARKLLEETDLTLETIAEKCGLGGMVSMRRTFLRHLMVSPSSYRRAFRSALQPPTANQFQLSNAFENDVN